MIRWFFLVSQLIWAVTMDALLPILLLLILNLAVLSVQGLQAKYIWRSFKLLLWFFIPTILMQGLFTPGMMVQQPIYLPLSIEGLMRGFYLSIHIAVMFFAALVVFRIFTKEEWLHFFRHLPYATALMPYVFLLFTLKRDVQNILFVQKKEWQHSQSKWKQLPNFLVDSIHAVLNVSKQAAAELWQDWDNTFAQSMAQSTSVIEEKLVLYVSFLVMGWVVFYL